MDRRITILNRTQQTTGRWGIDSKGVGWEERGTFWANVTWVKGMSAMREGSADVYGMIMVRMRWNNVVKRTSRVKIDGVIYEIQGETFHPDYRANTIQFTMREVNNG